TTVTHAQSAPVRQRSSPAVSNRQSRWNVHGHGTENRRKARRGGDGFGNRPVWSRNQIAALIAPYPATLEYPRNAINHVRRAKHERRLSRQARKHQAGQVLLINGL